MKEIVKFIKEGLKITSKTKVDKYNYHPKTKEELQDLLKQLIEERGNEGDFNDIDVSKIKDMSEVFDNINNRDKINGDISNWDVSNVEYMGYMFYGCDSFNQDISNWDVSNVINMASMFYGCESFNQDISKWNVSKVNIANNIFYNCPIEEKYKPKFK